MVLLKFRLFSRTHTNYILLLKITIIALLTILITNANAQDLQNSPFNDLGYQYDGTQQIENEDGSSVVLLNFEDEFGNKITISPIIAGMCILAYIQSELPAQIQHNFFIVKNFQ